MELREIGQQRRTLVSAIIAALSYIFTTSWLESLGRGCSPLRLNFWNSCELQDISNLIIWHWAKPNWHLFWTKRIISSADIWFKLTLFCCFSCCFAMLRPRGSLEPQRPPSWDPFQMKDCWSDATVITPCIELSFHIWRWQRPISLMVTDVLDGLQGCDKTEARTHRKIHSYI